MSRGLAVLAGLLLVCAAALAAQHGEGRAGEVRARTVHVDGLEREYLLYVPRSPASPAPLVFFFHGGGGPLGDAYLALERSGWRDTADAEGFLAVFPQGRLERPDDPMDLASDPSDPSRNIRSWSDGSGATPASRAGIDDVAFVRSVLEDIRRTHEVDEARIYLTGFSNGATMSYYLGTRLAADVAAIAPVAGLLYESGPPEPVSLMHVVGELDAAPPQGAQGSGNAYVPDPLARWRRSLACPERPAVEDAAALRVETFSPCEGGSAVVFYLFKGAGHVYPGASEFFGPRLPAADAVRIADVVWDFFERHPKTGGP